MDALTPGCNAMNRYVIKLTETSESQIQDSDLVIQYRELSQEEKALLQKALDDGQYISCRSALEDGEEGAAISLGTRIEGETSNGEIFLQINDQFYKLGLKVGDIIYAATVHGTDQST